MRFIIPPAILLFGLLAVTAPHSHAKAEFMKKEKKTCTHCHVTAKGPDLNDVGKYYKEKKTLDGAPAKSGDK